MRKKKIIIIITLILFILVVAFLFQKELVKRKPIDTLEMTERHRTELKPTVIGIDWLNNNQWLLVSLKSQKLPNNYYKDTKSFEYDGTSPIIGLKKLALIEQKNVEHMNTGNDTYYTTEFQVELYKVKKTKLKKDKTIDLNKLVKDYDSNYSVRAAFSFTPDEQFLEFAINGVTEFFFLDLQNEEIIKESDMDPTILKKTEESNQVPNEYEFINATNFQNRDVVTTNGLRAIQTNPNQEIGIRYKDKKALKPSYLEEKYPEIRKIYDNDGFGRLNYSQAPPSPEELAKLLVPKGVDPWEDVVIDANRSKDQQEHPIHSLEEFLKWYQPEEEQTTESKSE